MSEDKKKTAKLQVVFALCGGNSEDRGQVAGEIFKVCKGNCTRVVLRETLIQIAKDPKVFGVPSQYFLQGKLDEKFTNPIMVREGQIRNILRVMFAMLGSDFSYFNPSKIGVNNFRMMLLKTPREVLRYLGMEVARKAYADFLPKIAFKQVMGKYGTYLIEDIKYANEIAIAEEMFQVVYPINVISKGKKSEDDYSFLREDLSNYPVFSAIEIDKKDKKIAEQIVTICQKLEQDVNLRMASGKVKPLVFPVRTDRAGQPEVLKPGEIQVGNAIFSKKKVVWGDDEIIT